MVSLKKNISLFFINSLVFICFMGLFSIANACSSRQQECCKGTTLSCCPKLGSDSKGNQLSYDISACTIDTPIINIPVEPVEPIVKECSLGAVQYKTSGDCGTSKRKCCFGDKWSDWDEDCPEATCNASDKPSETEICTNSQNGKTGSKTRTVTCNQLTLKWNTGTWGACIYNCELAEMGFYRSCSNGKGQVWHTCECDYSSGTVKNCKDAGECLIFAPGAGGDEDGKVPTLPGLPADSL